MKIKLLLFTLLVGNLAFAQYAPVGDKIKTRWAEEVAPENVLSEYPRPMMVRPEWKNLNGLWQYAITAKGEKAPKKYEGDILVPFCIESALSGVQKEVGPDNALWYQKTFAVPAQWKSGRVLLHFGAVDLNYDRYISKGTSRLDEVEEYDSHNTERLDVEGMKKLLKKLEMFQ